MSPCTRLCPFQPALTFFNAKSVTTPSTVSACKVNTSFMPRIAGAQPAMSSMARMDGRISAPMRTESRNSPYVFQLS